MIGEQVRVWCVDGVPARVIWQGQTLRPVFEPTPEFKRGHESVPVSWHLVVTGEVAFERWYLRIKPHPDGSWSVLDLQPE